LHGLSKGNIFLIKKIIYKKSNLAPLDICPSFATAHTHPHTQLKKSGIFHTHTHTHTQSMQRFPVKAEIEFGQYPQGQVYLPSLLFSIKKSLITLLNLSPLYFKFVILKYFFVKLFYDILI